MPSSHLLRQQFVSGKTFAGARLLFPLEDSIHFSHDVPVTSLEDIKLSTPSLDLAFGYTCFSNMLQLLNIRLERESAQTLAHKARVISFGLSGRNQSKSKRGISSS
jgi:hypothetical protein